MIEIEPGDVFTRHPNNPIITVDQLPFRANSVFDPGAGLVGGETLLLIRVEAHAAHRLTRPAWRVPLLGQRNARRNRRSLDAPANVNTGQITRCSWPLRATPP